MVQRAGRIDRIGTEFDTLWIYNMYPDEGLDRLLGLVDSLSRKIADIDRAGFLDASVLGEAVHPQNFNTLRRIQEEDGSVIEEEEQFTELASSEFLMQQLRGLLDIRQVYKDFQISTDVKALLDSVLALVERFVAEDSPGNGSGGDGTPLSREDLRLICFDAITGV